MSKFLIDGKLYDLISCGHIVYDVADDYQVEEKSEMN